MKNRALFLCISFVFLAAFSWQKAAYAKTIDRIVAVVDDEAITQHQLDSLLKQKKKELAAMREYVQGDLSEEQMKNLALEKLIGEVLVDREILRRKIVVTDKDVETAIQNILKRNDMTEKQLASELKSKGSALESYRRDLKKQLRMVKFMGQVIAPRVRVTDMDLEEFFAKNPKQFAQYQSVEIAQIILPLDANATTEELLAANARAAEVLKLARSARSLEKLGKKYSSFPELSKKESYPVSQLNAQLAAVISGLQEGQVSEAIRSNMGLHIVKLFSRKTLGGEEYRAIREQMREKVFELKVQEEMGRYVQELKESHYVEVKI